MDTLNILHLIDTLGFGGAERILVDSLAEMRLAAPRCRNIVCTLCGVDNELALPEGVTRVNLEMTPRNLPITYARLTALAWMNRIQIMHSHLLASTYIARAVFAPRLIGRVATYHGHTFSPHLPDFSLRHSILERYTYRSGANVSLYVSGQVADELKGLRGCDSRDLVLNNFPGPDFKPGYRGPLSREGLRVLMVAGLKTIKNLSLPIGELARISDDITLDIYGDGPMRELLGTLAENSSGRVRILGLSPMSTELYAKYDLFLISSLSEGLPVSLLEAMAVGLPSVLPLHQAIYPEIAGESAYYYSIHRSGDLAATLERIAREKDVLQIKSAEALKLAGKFNRKRYVMDLLEVYRSISRRA